MDPNTLGFKSKSPPGPNYATLTHRADIALAMTGRLENQTLLRRECFVDLIKISKVVCEAKSDSQVFRSSHPPVHTTTHFLTKCGVL